MWFGYTCLFRLEVKGRIIVLDFVVRGWKARRHLPVVERLESGKTWGLSQHYRCIVYCDTKSLVKKPDFRQRIISIYIISLHCNWVNAGIYAYIRNYLRQKVYDSGVSLLILVFVPSWRLSNWKAESLWNERSNNAFVMFIQRRENHSYIRFTFKMSWQVA